MVLPTAALVQFGWGAVSNLLLFTVSCYELRCDSSRLPDGVSSEKLIVRRIRAQFTKVIGC